MSVDVVAALRVDTGANSSSVAVHFDYPLHFPVVATSTEHPNIHISIPCSHPAALATPKFARAQPPAPCTSAAFLTFNTASPPNQTPSTTSSTTHRAQGSATPFNQPFISTPVNLLQHSTSSYARQHSAATAAGGSGGNGGGNSEGNPAPHRAVNRRGKNGGKKGGRKVKRGGGGGGGGGDDDEPPRRTPRKTENACGFCRGRKLKCDGIKPTCSNCDRRHIACEYGDIRRRGPGKKTKAKRGNRQGHSPSAEPDEQPAVPGSSTGPGTREQGVELQGFEAHRAAQQQQQQQQNTQRQHPDHSPMLHRASPVHPQPQYYGQHLMPSEFYVQPAPMDPRYAGYVQPQLAMGGLAAAGVGASGSSGVGADAGRGQGAWPGQQAHGGSLKRRASGDPQDQRDWKRPSVGPTEGDEDEDEDEENEDDWVDEY